MMPRIPPRSKVAWAILLACLLANIALVFCDVGITVSQTAELSALSFSDTPAGTVKLSPGAHEETLVLPFSNTDARWWVIHTRQMLRDSAWRVRHTNLDNAPDGREVHWSSFLMWVLALLAWIRSWGTGQPADFFVADATLAAGPFLLTLLLGGLSILIGRRFGWLNALFFAVVFLSSQPLVGCFLGGDADHHGIVNSFIAGCAICILAAGGGCVSTGRNKASRLVRLAEDSGKATNWFIASGLLGSVALWISAATALPILAGLSLGGLLAGIDAIRSGKGDALQPSLWLKWGTAGAAGCIFFYLLEYFPHQMGWRLEVNHPFYAGAWIAGSFLLTTLLEQLRGKQGIRGWRQLGLITSALIALALPLGLILFAPDRFFWVRDKFLFSLHQQYIYEFLSMPALMKANGGSWSWLAFYPWPLAVGGLITALLLTKKLGAFGRSGLLLLAPATILLQSMAVWQARWNSTCFAMWAVCALTVMIAIRQNGKATGALLYALRTLLATACIAFFVPMLPTVLHRMTSKTASGHPIVNEVAGNLLVRDIALRLIQSSPDRIPVVLAGPNVSTEMSYHAGLHTIGTLYWENVAGLKKAAEIFSATTDQEALGKLQAAGVTHIVVPSWDNFAEAYARLLAEARGTKSAGTPFFKAIVEGDDCPPWLRPFAYPIPTGAGLDTASVRIFAVLPEQSEFESFYYRGIYYEESGKKERAREMFGRAAQLRPTDERVQRALQRLKATPEARVQHE